MKYRLPRRHIVMVEVTDMEVGYSTDDITRIIKNAVDLGLYKMVPEGVLSNLTVRNPKRVMTNLKIQSNSTIEEHLNDHNYRKRD